MKIETITEETAWNRAISSFERFDFFHSFPYHWHRAKAMDARPMMLTVSDSQQIVFALPTLKRSIDEEYFDLVSVYGYSGPLYNSTTDANKLLAELQPKLASIGCVSLFSRLHPMINSDIEPRNSEILEIGNTIVVDLGKQIDELISTYRKTTRYEINRLSKMDVHVDFHSDPGSISIFQEIYRSTMKDLNADTFYYFDDEFIQSLFSIENVKTTIGILSLEGKPISAAIFTVCGNIAQYFLGGALREYSKLAPQKLLLHRAFQWAAQSGANVIHLGGGRGAKEDGLFRFKAGFSDKRLPFRIVKMISNPSKYRELTESFAEKNQLDAENLLSAEAFFPGYRSPVSI